jgi:hypothetical protein
MSSALPARPPQLSRETRRAVYAIGGGIWFTGGAWLLLHYFLAADGPFGPSPHWLEFWSRAAHGLFGIGSIWLFGMLWGAHVTEGWRSLRRRWTGSVMFGLFAWLVASGYLLYYLGNDRLIAATSLLHWSVGLLCPLPFVLHLFATPRKKHAGAATAG